VTENTTHLITNIIGNCPRCNASWVGSEIPEKYRDEHYSGATHYSKLIGMEDRDIYDGAHSYQCPDCRAVFPRIVEYHAKWKLKMQSAGAEIIFAYEDDND